MNNEILFTEQQKFRQWGLWLILLSINVLFILGSFKQLVSGEQFGNRPMSNTGLLITTGFTILLSILFFNFRLDTIIKNDGIYVRFFPFHLKFKYYPWTTLNKSFVRQYFPISEYGGWGLRFGFFGKGRAYNVSGNKGLQLVFNNNKKLLIGTNKPKQLVEVLNKIGQLNH